MEEDNKNITEQIEESDKELVTEKKTSEWDRMKIFLFSHKRYVLTLFPIILVAIFLGSMCSSFQKNGYILYFVLCLVGVVLLLGLSIFMVIITKKIFIENKVSTNVYISIIFAYMFLSGFLLMIFYKILSMIDAKNILNITGLVSVIVTVVYILMVVASFYIDFSKFKKHKNKEDVETPSK